MYNIIKVIWLFNNTTWKFKNRFQYINNRIIILCLKKTQKKNNTCHKRAHISSNNIVSNWLTNCFQFLCIRKLSSYMELINYEFTTIKVLISYFINLLIRKKDVNIIYLLNVIFNLPHFIDFDHNVNTWRIKGYNNRTAYLCYLWPNQWQYSSLFLFTLDYLLLLIKQWSNWFRTTTTSKYIWNQV